jgi:hypothetical protein
MLVTAWTDASFKDGVTGAVSMIIADDIYLGSRVARYRTLTPYDAEMIGIIQVLEFIQKESIAFSKLLIYTDSMAIAGKYAEINETGKNIDEVFLPPKSVKKWKRIMDLTRGRNVHIEYTAGHQEKNNPNKLCDVAARIIVEEGS